MSRLRIRISMNKGQRGIYLDKLEKIVSETRKFLASMGEDIEVTDPNAKWIGLDFRNGSLSYTVEYPYQVKTEQQHRFNAGILSLVKGQRPPFLKTETASQFYHLPEILDQREKIKIGIFPNGGNRLKWLEVSKNTAVIARQSLTDSIQYIGAAQGRIHSLYKEIKQPFFYLRELSSGALIKCFYDTDRYDLVARALQFQEQIIHVHGRVYASMIGRTIDHIDVDDILTPKPFGLSDVDDFLQSKEVQ